MSDESKTPNTLRSLEDIDLGTLADGDVITWDESEQKFKNAAPSVTPGGDQTFTGNVSFTNKLYIKPATQLDLTADTEIFRVGTDDVPSSDYKSIICSFIGADGRITFVQSDAAPVALGAFNFYSDDYNLQDVGSAVETVQGGLSTLQTTVTGLSGQLDATDDAVSALQTSDTAKGTRLSGLENLGGLLQASRAVGSALALTTATDTTITSIVLTPGEWDVDGVVGYIPAATTTVTYVRQGPSQTTDTLPSEPMFSATPCGAQTGTALGGRIVQNIPMYRTSVEIGQTETVYLVGKAVFATSTLTAFGRIEARRVKQEAAE